MDSTVSVTTNPLQTILGIASIVGRWKIFEDYGEKGWKALIPFYSDYIFGRCFGEEKLGKGLAWSLVGLVVSAIGFFSALSISIYSSMDSSELLNFVNQLQNDPSAPLDLPTQALTGGISIGLGLIVFTVLLVLFAVLTLVLSIKLHYRFTLYNDAPTWWIVVWIFLPAIAYIYFAFLHKRVDIPGVTQKEMDE